MMKGTSLLFVLALKRLQNVEIERSDAALILATIWPVRNYVKYGEIWKNTGKYGSKAIGSAISQFCHFDGWD